MWKKIRLKRKAARIDLQVIFQSLENCPDIIRKKVIIGRKQEGYFLYVNNLTNTDLIHRDFIKPILALDPDALKNERTYQNLACDEIAVLQDSETVIESILTGNCVFVCDVMHFSIACILPEYEKRTIEEPVTEKNVRGPHEGFIEPLDSNMAILRRKIKNNRLKFKTVVLGEQTNQKVAVAYIEGIANLDIVNSLFDKIRSIKLDGLMSIGHLEQSIESHPFSIFPQFLSTERPDKAVAGLLEGRIVVMLEGTPVVLIAPISFLSFFQALDDYSTKWIHGTFLRLVRIAALLVAVLLPALYIAVNSYHYYVIPLRILIPLAEDQARVPYPPIIEVLILEAFVEMIREAAVRLPTYIGIAISVFATLVIGQAAVEAGLVSNVLIVIVGAAAVASYVIPSHDMAMTLRIVRFGFAISAAIFGMMGIVVCIGLTTVHLVTMESLGQPYYQPFAPMDLKGWKDALIRFPIWSLKKRPRMVKTENKKRSGKHAGK